MIFLTSVLGPSIPTITPEAVSGIVIIAGAFGYAAWQFVQLIRGK